MVRFSQNDKTSGRDVKIEIFKTKNKRVLTKMITALFHTKSRCVFD